MPHVGRPGCGANRILPGLTSGVHCKDIRHEC